VPLGRVDLEQILCIEDRRVVGRDNVAPTVAGAGNVAGSNAWGSPRRSRWYTPQR
jgi:hypothetical protein